MPNFVYLVKPVFKALTQEIGQAEADFMKHHFSYLETLQKAGRLVLAGPAEDGSFGLVVLEAESLEEAEKIMHNDPVVGSGIMKGSCHPFTISIMNCN